MCDKPKMTLLFQIVMLKATYLSLMGDCRKMFFYKKPEFWWPNFPYLRVLRTSILANLVTSTVCSTFAFTLWSRLLFYLCTSSNMEKHR